MDLTTTVDPASTALIVVDLANEFYAGDGWRGTRGLDMGTLRRPMLAAIEVPFRTVAYGDDAAPARRALTARNIHTADRS